MNWTLNKHQLWVVPQFLEPKLLQITRWILWFLANMFKVFMWFINQTNITGGAPPCRIAWRENLQESPLDLPLEPTHWFEEDDFFIMFPMGNKTLYSGNRYRECCYFFGGFPTANASSGNEPQKWWHVESSAMGPGLIKTWDFLSLSIASTGWFCRHTKHVHMCYTYCSAFCV